MVLFILWYFLWNFYHTYLRLKNAFSVRPVQAVAMAMTKVVIPKVEWIGTRAARKDAVADSQHNKSKKLKKPTINWKKRDKLMSVRLGLFFLWWFLIYFNIKGFPYQESSKSFWKSFHSKIPGEYFLSLIFYNVPKLETFSFSMLISKNLTYFEPPCKKLLRPNDGSIHRLIA